MKKSTALGLAQTDSAHHYQAFVGATLIDGTGGASRPDATVLIENEHISAVGNKIAIPKDARVFDVSGIRVVETLPPFVDTPLTANMPGRKMSPAAVVDATLRAIERGRDEVFVGRVRYLPWLMRLAPGLASRLVANS